MYREICEDIEELEELKREISDLLKELWANPDENPNRKKMIERHFAEMPTEEKFIDYCITNIFYAIKCGKNKF